MAYKTSISISNLRDKEITFHLEPWGQQFPMPAGCTFQIVAEAEEQGVLEIEYEEDNILAWAWSGSILTLYCDGQAISSNNHRVPPVPEGKSVSSFIRLIEGKK